MLENVKLREMGRVARASSTRAYAGHSSSYRHIFDIKNLNLTEYSRSFALYKTVSESIKSTDKKQRKETQAHKEAVMEKEEQTGAFTRRLQKSKIKELQQNMYGKKDDERQKAMDELERVSKAFYTPEARLEMRKAGFGRAALHANVKKDQLNEFM
jgi:hypothetical protein